MASSLVRSCPGKKAFYNSYSLCDRTSVLPPSRVAVEVSAIWYTISILKPSGSAPTPTPSAEREFPDPPSLLMRHLHYAGCLIFLVLVSQSCATIPRYQAQGEFLDDTVSTTVDSEIARYYLENYLQGKRTHPSFDEKIDWLYQKQGPAQPSREELKEISRAFSVDFATLFLADRLWAIEENRTLHKTFNQFLKEKKPIRILLPPTIHPISCCSYRVGIMWSTAPSPAPTWPHQENW